MDMVLSVTVQMKASEYFLRYYPYLIFYTMIFVDFFLSDASLETRGVDRVKVEEQLLSLRCDCRVSQTGPVSSSILS